MSHFIDTTLLVLALGGSGERPPAILMSGGEALRGDASVELSIPARHQAPDSPKSGWCGETAIQEALLHFGVWAPQRLINRSGKPRHPDLYSSDIPIALRDLGMKYEFYAPRKPGFAAYLDWIRQALDAGEPVLAGVKLLPTRHPEWGLDHFVLVVGYGPKGLLVNTTWGYQQWANDRSTQGISFANVVYGIRLHSVVSPPSALPARLSVVEEAERIVRLQVTCDGASAGVPYRIEQRRSMLDKQLLWSDVPAATPGRIGSTLTIAATEVSHFFCTPLPVTDARAPSSSR